jgi:hypothetical protein
MKTFFIIMILLNAVFCSAQQNMVHIDGNSYEGYIFPKFYEKNKNWMPFDSALKRFTPTKEDILIAEKALKEQLEIMNKSLMNQGKNCPVIHENLKRYKRQYFGFINENGEKIVWINLIWDKEKHALKCLSKDLIFVLDGCSHYWNIKVNLNQVKLLDLIVNGSA